MSQVCRLSKSYCFAFFLLHVLLLLEIDCADQQFCAIWWKDTLETGLHSCLYSSKYHICGVQVSRKTSAWLNSVGTSGSFFRTCLLSLLERSLPELPCVGWLNPIRFLFTYQRVDFRRIAGDAQRLLSKACKMLLCTCMQLINFSSATTTEQKYFLYSSSFSCSPAFVPFLHSPNIWRDIRAKIVTVLLRNISGLQPPLQSWIQLQLSWISTLKKNPLKA